MTTVMAQGVFDILHPGHLHYLRRSRNRGNELVVVIARDSRVQERKDLVFDEDERQEMVEALEMVDMVVLGSEEDIYETVRRIDPDIITLGYDQEHREEDVKEMAEEATGNEIKIVRIDGHGDYSSSELKS